MAAKSNACLKKLCLFSILFFILLHQVSCEKWPPCTQKNFKRTILKCNPLTKRSRAVYSMIEQCDLKNNQSVEFPRVQENLPCYCNPGFGLLSDVSGSCGECKPGEYSYGGELISNFTDWNSIGDSPHPSYQAYAYCSDFLSGKSCPAWLSGGSGEYIVSGPFKDTSLRCFEQSILIFNREFVAPAGSNKVSFLHRVEGRECRNPINCPNGLFFYVDGNLTMHSELQFQWKKFETDVKPGHHQIKFVYQRSCTKNNITDVVYLKHIAMVSSSSLISTCTPCPAGTFSNTTKSSECHACPANSYQPLPGKSQCLPCETNQYSRIGATKCKTLPKCTSKDYYKLPKSINTCKLEKDKWLRQQTSALPKWPGGRNACLESTDTKPSLTSVTNCTCQPGQVIRVKDDNRMIKCSSCPTGTFSSDGVEACKHCPEGSAAIKGFYIDTWPEDIFSNHFFVEECTLDICKENYVKSWYPRGEYMASARLPGNFESVLNVENVFLDYYKSVVEFECSLDCSLDDRANIAKYAHCNMKLIVIKDGAQVHSKDCVSKYATHLRNGTRMSHKLFINEPGIYSFTLKFHHEDEGENTLLSYEARFYKLGILGMKSGHAKQCVKCPAGTCVSDNQALCEKCPPGTFSNAGATSCTKCPINTFANKENTAKCLPCGAGTTSNKERTECEYNKCVFSPSADVTFDLTPLQVDGGPMYKVKLPDKIYSSQVYYLNICSKTHDNSSCTVVKRNRFTSLRIRMRELLRTPISYLRHSTTYNNQTHVKFLQTMACRQYSFDLDNSYSIGNVMGFHALPAERLREGLKIVLKGGDTCWSSSRKFVQPKTTISMQCDMLAGVGQPTPLISNTTVVSKTNCEYEFLWKTLYACPLCKASDYTTTYSACVNESRLATKKRASACRTPGSHDSEEFETKHYVDCEKQSEVPLIVVVVLACVLVVILLVVLVYMIRRNRQLRSNLFSSSQQFSKVQADDEEELVENM